MQNYVYDILLLIVMNAIFQQDIALLSLGNILHKSGEFDDALTVVNMALEAGSEGLRYVRL